MKILVTGAAGFIAYHTIKKFLQKNYQVYGIDNLNNYYSTKLKKDRVKDLKIFAKKNNKKFFFFKKDINNILFLRKLIKKHKFKNVIHLAAQAGVRYSVTNPEPYVKSNLLGFVNILELCKQNKVEHLIYASSSSVYGLNNKKIFSEKNDATHPLNLYAATKRSNEMLAHSYSFLHNLKTTGLRFFTVYGPWGRPDMAYYSFLNNLYKNKAINLHNHGIHKRDFSYIDHIVDGIFQIFNNKKNKKLQKIKNLSPDQSLGPFQIYNIATGKPKTLMEFVNTIEKLTGKKFKKKFIGYQAGDIENTYADTKKFKLNFKITSKVSLKLGLSKFIDWYKNYYNIN